MADVVRLLTTEEVDTEGHQPQINLDSFVQTAQGIFEATKVGHFNYTALLFCIYLEDQAAIIFLEAIKQWKKAIADKDIDDILGAAFITFAGFQQVKKGLPACEDVNPHSLDWTHFDKIVAAMEDPEKHMVKIGENIVFNGKTVTKEIKEAGEALNAGNYEDFGFQVGSFLETAVEGSAEQFLF